MASSNFQYIILMDDLLVKIHNFNAENRKKHQSNAQLSYRLQKFIRYIADKSEDPHLLKTQMYNYYKK